MNTQHFSERDICTKFITPAVKRAGWDEMSQIREEVSFTKGRIIVRGKLVTRGKSKRADYVLYYKPNLPLAIIEAKDNKHSVGDGMQQGLEYAETLDIPFVFSSSGDGFVFHDRTGTKARLVEVDTRFLISYSCCLIRPKQQVIDKEFLRLFLDSHLALGQAHSGVKNIGVPDLGLGEIKACRIPLPSLAEQHRIAAKMDELMALCDQMEAQLITTQAQSRMLLEAVLQQALSATSPAEKSSIMN